MLRQVPRSEAHDRARLVVEKAADDVAETASALLLLAAASAGLLSRRVEVGALEADPARTREAVEHEVASAAGEEAGLEPVDLLLHLHRVVAEQPAPGLYVDRLPRLERLLEHVPVAVDPDDALVVAGEELVDPEATAIEHVGEALDPGVVVLDAARRGQELVLAHDDSLARLKVERDDVAGSVPAERDLARRLRLEHQQRQAAEHAPLQTLAQRVQPDLHLGVLPQERVVLELDRDLAVEGHVEDRDELAFEAIFHARRDPVLDLRGKDLGGRRHGDFSVSGTWSGSREPLPSTPLWTVSRAATGGQATARCDRPRPAAIIAPRCHRSTSPATAIRTRTRSRRRSAIPSSSSGWTRATTTPRCASASATRRHAGCSNRAAPGSRSSSPTPWSAPTT